MLDGGATDSGSTENGPVAPGDLDLLQRALDTELPADETGRRILRAAGEQAEDFGLRRFTIDDVARRVGLSRVTIYRYFPKKDALLNALLMQEMRRFLTKVEAVVDAQTVPEDRLVHGVVFALEFLRDHRLLNRLLRTEPELILPYLTTQAGPVVSAARNWLVALISLDFAPADAAASKDIEYFAELLTRTVISLVITPATVLPLDSPRERQRLIEMYVSPLTQVLRPREG